MRTVASMSPRKPRRMRSSSSAAHGVDAAARSRRAARPAASSAPVRRANRSSNSSHQQRGRLRVRGEHVVLVRLGERRRDLLPVAAQARRIATSRHGMPPRATRRPRLSDSVSPRQAAAAASAISSPQPLEVDLPRPHQDAEVVQVRAVLLGSPTQPRRHLLDDRRGRDPRARAGTADSATLPPCLASVRRVSGARPRPRARRARSAA